MVSIAEIALSKILPIWVVILINVVIFAVAMIGCITTETVRDEIVRQDGKLKESVFNIRELQSISATLVDQCGDEELKKSLKKLADDFRYSDPLSSDKTQTLETEMQVRIGELQQAVIDGDIESAKQLCDKLAGNLRERNRICAVNK